MKSGASSHKAVSIIGIGSYLPERVMTNADLEKMVDTSNEWIVQRTGISTRRIASPEQAASDLATEAARRALDHAGVTPDEIDMIIVASISPDMVFPNTACLVQEKLGASRAFCFGLEAACSGFVYALETARNFVASGTVKTALVIGAEKLSAITDWQDRNTCVLFGDGAGAVVLRAGAAGRGLMACAMGSDGGLAHLLNMPAGGSRLPASHETVDKRQHFIRMEGREVFKHAVRCMCEAGRNALEQSGLKATDLTWVVPHQANMRIIQAIGERFGVPMDRFIINIDKVGNLSGASVPVALDEAVRDGRVKKGDVLLFIVFGGGFTWGAMALEWDR